MSASDGIGRAFEAGLLRSTPGSGPLRLSQLRAHALALLAETEVAGLIMGRWIRVATGTPKSPTTLGDAQFPISRISLDLETRVLHVDSLPSGTRRRVLLTIVGTDTTVVVDLALIADASFTGTTYKWSTKFLV